MFIDKTVVMRYERQFATNSRLYPLVDAQAESPRGRDCHDDGVSSSLHME